ncbi:DUF1491 family protein [Aquibium oceanicum]|uniref:DUF1491 family protein n=1 Tax=Aquibium oceanicum TaxID=1670800 RepID=A0A1L3SQ22_9HYPH|nr:DUF1491 family protein [Aquibium oceanicum]APH71516.1 hypothetical protein BSQ44_09130 [Aquibium oceanicum]
MRVTSDFFVSSLIRRVFGEGGFAAVMRKGAAEAGAVFIVIRGREGDSTLLGPAPQSGYDEKRPGGRQFVVLEEKLEEDGLSARITREARFDPDVWFVELDTPRLPEDLVDIMKP